MSKCGDMTELDEPERLRKRVEALEAALKDAAEALGGYAECTIIVRRQARPRRPGGQP